LDRVSITKGVIPAQAGIQWLSQRTHRARPRNDKQELHR
jgi:hypothetical protein